MGAGLFGFEPQPLERYPSSCVAFPGRQRWTGRVLRSHTRPVFFRARSLREVRQRDFARG
jgi:hypothetical protein